VDEVFAYLSDVEHGPQYISGQREAHQTSPGPMRLGTTFASTGTFLRRSGTNTVTEYELDRRLAWQETSGARATTAWRFEPTSGSTRVTFTRVSEASGLLRLAEPLRAKLANSQIEHDLGALKELLAVSRKPASMAKGW
jgi:polyketide cyclase/dehydrase/lipid transport protein